MRAKSKTTELAGPEKKNGFSPAEKKHPGRPTKQTDRRTRILLEALRKGLPLKIACDYAKIGERTAYDWMQRDPEFRAEVDFAKAHAVDNLVERVTKRDPWRILKCIAPHHFRDQIDVNSHETKELRLTTPDGKSYLVPF